jgi:adenylate cyclase
VDAVQCGVAVQNELKARNPDLPEFRIGINLGDVIEEEDGIHGDGVNIAAKLASCADAGAICASKTAFDHIETKLPLEYENRGEKEVKNIAMPVGAYRVLMEPRGAQDRKPTIPLWRRTGAGIRRLCTERGGLPDVRGASERGKGCKYELCVLFSA